ncbi:MAG: DUF4468 domain-containing protein [Cytophagia bacterium]|nr:DUF4468 domain-containing protein [Cytophagia bacterium]
MKHIGCLILFITLSSSALAQRASLLMNDSSIKEVNIQAMNMSYLMTNVGNMLLDEIEMASFPEENAQYQGVYEKLRQNGIIVVFSATGEFPEPFQFESKSSLYISDLPFDDTGELILSEVIQQTGSADDLYLRGKLMIANNFKSANDVIQLDDKDAHILVGKGWSSMWVRYLLGVDYRLYYSLKIEARNNRYRYSIYDFKLESVESSTDVNPSSLFLKENYYRNNGKERAFNKAVKLSIQRKLKELRIMILNDMQTIAKKDDWE